MEELIAAVPVPQVVVDKEAFHCECDLTNEESENLKSGWHDRGSICDQICDFETPNQTAASRLRVCVAGSSLTIRRHTQRIVGAVPEISLLESVG